MCERCNAGFVFLGLAEPQIAMLAGYVRALESGWTPHDSSFDRAARLAEIARDGSAFLATLADRVIPGRSVRLTRWLWDGDFCGEATLVAAPGQPVCMTCSLVSSRLGHGYEDRALRQLRAEASTLDSLGHGQPLDGSMPHSNTQS